MLTSVQILTYFNEILEIDKVIIAYLVSPSSRYQTHLSISFEVLESRDQALMPLINSCMNTYVALGDLAIIPPIPSLKPPEKNRGR
jgi:hypothetical protein